MKIIKGFKAFNKGLKCQGFQYKVGKEYKHEGDIELCKKGFHFCENPLDVLNYYDLCDSEFAKVETNGKTEKDKEDTKICSDKIKIVSKIDLPMFVKASIDFLWQKCSKNNGFLGKIKAASGYGSQLAASGDYSKLAASGDYSKLAASGDYSKLAASGDYSKLAASGNGSQLAASGYGSQLAASGDDSQLAASGNGSQLAASGDDSQLAASGDDSKLEMLGKESVGANIGIGGSIKGKKGNWITLAEYKDGKPICVKTEKIDGKIIKEDIWYKLQNGKFVKSKA